MTGVDREDAKHSVEKGWSFLIDSVYDRLSQCSSAFVSTVKEKYGGLRIYVGGIDDETQDFLDAIEEKSFTVCEFCGKPGKPRNSGWIKTLCDDCVRK